mmetsp:Transcript_6014/g.11787  ORF Transcript_6014/g.11787 Transcript_6014/m.11787 type:complete len:1118 (+) Transcript_6014:86-3439(+)
MLFACLFKDNCGGSNREKVAKLEKCNSSCVCGYTDLFKMLAFCFLMVDGKYVVADHSAGMRVLTEESNGGVVKVFANLNKCMDAHPDNQNVYMYDCIVGNPNQYFEYDSTSQRITHKGLCVNYDPGTTNVNVETCNEGSNQKWRYDCNTQELKTFHDDKCLDWGNDNLYMHDCHGGSNQKYLIPKMWMEDPSFKHVSVRVVSDLNKCMEANPSDDNVYLNDCDQCNPNQHFEYDASSRKITLRGLCLDNHMGNSNVYMYACNGGRNQQWYFNTFTKALKTFHDEKCLDWGNNNLYMHECHGGSNQQFVIPSNWAPSIFLNNVHIVKDLSKCMSAQPDTGNVYIQNCEDTNADQFFFYYPNTRQIKHRGLCLDYDYAGVTTDNNVRMYKCVDVNNQKWHYNSITKELKTFHDENCLDWGYGNLYMGSCHGGNNQQFEIPNWSMKIANKDDPDGTSLLDDDLAQIAQAAIDFQLDNDDSLGLRDQLDSFLILSSSENQASLKKTTMTALSKATIDQIEDLIDEKTSHFCPALKTWNDSGYEVSYKEDGRNPPSKRVKMCETIKDSTHLSDTVKSCMCGFDKPYIYCEIILGEELAVEQHRRIRERSRQLESVDDSRKLQQCALTVNGVKDGVPNMFNIIDMLTNQPQGISIYGQCEAPMPPPVSFISLAASIGVEIPNEPYYTEDGAKNSELKGSNEIKMIGGLSASLIGNICLYAGGIDKLKGIEDLLEIIGIDLCFIETSLKIWPLRGHSSVHFRAFIGSFVSAKIALSIQMYNVLRDSLGLCDGVEPNCESSDTLFCQMDEGELVGYFELGLWFYLWEATFTLFIGPQVYDDCNKYDDGTLCLLGTSCFGCKNPATYWYGKAFTACGTEARWDDGTVCLAGSSCSQCKNPATFWPDATFTWKCGSMDCWKDGTICLEGTTCNSCCNPSTFWPDRDFTFKCGEMPCWEEGTTCLLSTTCNSCCHPPISASDWKCSGNDWGIMSLSDGRLLSAHKVQQGEKIEMETYFYDNQYCVQMANYRTCEGKPANAQKFKKPNRDAKWAIKVLDSNLCLDVPAFGGHGTTVQLYECNGQSNQNWYYDDKKRLHPMHAPHLCLDNAGMYAMVWNCHDGNNQKWKF